MSRLCLRSTPFLMLTIASLLGAASWAQDTTASRIESLAKPYIDADMTVGLSIGVIKQGETTEVHLGQAREGVLPDSSTIYEIGSVSKVFTGIMLADAVNRGEVQLDQSIQDLLPEGVTAPSWEGQPVKVVHMATHASGLPRLSDNMPSVTSDNPYSDYTSKLAYEFLHSHKLRRAPGEKGEYSNFAMSVLGDMLCRKAGANYDDLLTQRITGPLEMNDTHVALTDSMQSRLATPHIAAGTTTVNWDFADMPGAGGIRSSTADMLRFAKACLDPPDNEAGRAIELAWKKHRPSQGEEFAMGLGWHLARDGSTRWHSGQTGGYHSVIFVNRQFKIAVVLLANTAQLELDTLGNDLMLMLAGADVKPREFEKTIDVSKKAMDRYVGRYELVPGFVFTVSAEGKKLMVGITNQPTVQVFPRSETEWFYKIVDATLTFKVDDDGNCNELELFQNGVRQSAIRIE